MRRCRDGGEHGLEALRWGDPREGENGERKTKSGWSTLLRSPINIVSSHRQNCHFEGEFLYPEQKRRGVLFEGGGLQGNLL